ncbi:hypothetical protein HCU74_09055 [Spongiibacter sp. KMU-166]|uniref:Transposase n=1 Tax=Spongiibacter thalassae TaxID=2721624 RepID=A0ABX1GF45_9GAMM|nr:hypothetical protein [Spongiibacter thalassae]NKI17565.1 hypothetical protein [Spongiibacter thalassae]
MKVHLELEIEPEELRRLIGLPDMQMIWGAVQDRISDGDTEMVQQIAKTAMSEGMKTVDITTRLLKTLSGIASRREDSNESTDQKEPKKAAPRRRSSSSTSKSKE